MANSTKKTQRELFNEINVHTGGIGTSLELYPNVTKVREKEFKASQITSHEYKVFQMYHGEPMKVRVRFSNHLADAVIDQFGKDLILVPEGEKHFIALLPVEISPPFFAWIATFGHAAKILYPDRAIEKMRKFIADVNDMYKDEGEK